MDFFVPTLSIVWQNGAKWDAHWRRSVEHSSHAMFMSQGRISHCLELVLFSFAQKTLSSFLNPLTRSDTAHKVRSGEGLVTWCTERRGWAPEQSPEGPQRRGYT